ncbi:uncharacterized protein MONOS_18605 [Monocercomonoides exilis]|uniref:uncharacterized protein n=1 Tax=Monocercomonoides exilis TaxID=2049356 RepID=UPI003559531C|nr:hypothetical protein MONOS_18605 [Monocercomonoides exilis]
MRPTGYILSAALVYMSISGIVMGILLFLTPEDQFFLSIPYDQRPPFLRRFSSYFGLLVFVHALIVFSAMYLATRNRFFMFIFGFLERWMWSTCLAHLPNKLFNDAFFPRRYVLSLLVVSWVIILSSLIKLLEKYVLKRPSKAPQNLKPPLQSSQPESVSQSSQNS